MERPLGLVVHEKDEVDSMHDEDLERCDLVEGMGIEVGSVGDRRMMGGGR